MAKILGASESGILAQHVVHPTKHSDDVQKQIQLGIEKTLAL